MNLQNVDLLSLQTESMKRDPVTIAMCKALTTKFQQIGQESKTVLIYSRVDDLDNDTIDELALQMHVDFYDTNLPLDVKRKLVKNSLKWHKIKGTPAAVEEFTAAIFGDAELSEWFEYNGKPYTFRLAVNLIPEINERLRVFYKGIDTVKNVRSHLDKVMLKSNHEIKVDTDFKHYSYNFNMCGTFLCGIKPDYSTQGKKLAETLKIKSQNNVRVQKQRMTGTFEAGEEEIR